MQDEIKIEYFKTPFGELVLGEYNMKLCLCDWRFRKMRDSIDRKIQTALNAEWVEKKSVIIEETKRQLNQYLNQDRSDFDIPLCLVGTDFQKRVWNALLKIPHGKTMTYSALSKQLGDINAIRSVASANGANPIAIIIPCHRIIGSDGSMVGYAGGIDVKKRLLQLEKALPENQLSLF
jgi:methylated-DNA-[protein]-cysteine S-methyltransferase